MFYAAGALGERNPWWPAAARPLGGYVHRLSELLRQGDRVSDVGLYVPARDVYAAMRPDREGSLDLWRGVRDHIGPDIPRIVREQGYDVDLFDDDAVQVLDPGRFPAVVLPFVRDLPRATRAWLRAAEERGVRVLALSCAVGVGTSVRTAADLPAALLSALPPDVSVTPREGVIGAVHRHLDGADVYLVANTGARTERFDVTLRGARTTLERWDALSGDVVARGPGSGPIPLTLEAYEAAVLVAFDGDDAPAWQDPAAPDVLVLDGPWNVRLPVED
jgi:hypothetical protein